MVTCGDHVRPTGAPLEPGVYRVVGAGDPVALLRVADADGRRVHGGDLERVAAATLAESFETARNPDAGRSPRSSGKNLVQGLYWSVRRVF